MLPFSWPSCYFKTRLPSCYFKTRLPSCALGTSFYTISEGRDLMTYVSDNYTSYSAPSPLNFNPLPFHGSEIPFQIFCCTIQDMKGIFIGNFFNIIFAQLQIVI